jgi:hypothetical protein
VTKTMDKEVVEKITKQKRNKEEKRAKQVVNFTNVINKVVQRLTNKCHETKFCTTWLTIAINEQGINFNSILQQV